MRKTRFIGGSPNPDRRLPVGGGVQPVANCEIAERGECGMKSGTRNWAKAHLPPISGHQNGIGACSRAGSHEKSAKQGTGWRGFSASPDQPAKAASARRRWKAPFESSCRNLPSSHSRTSAGKFEGHGHAFTGCYDQTDRSALRKSHPPAPFCQGLALPGIKGVGVAKVVGGQGGIDLFELRCHPVPVGHGLRQAGSDAAHRLAQSGPTGASRK